MDYQTFIDRLEDRADLWSRDKAEKLAKTTVEVLGETLSTPERTWMMNHLPAPLGDALTRTWGDQTFDLDEFYDRISHREGLVDDFAAQQSRVVCRVLAEQLDDDVLDYLLDHLPAPFPALFHRQV
jgi:uncharacterized protein (DUF2267 family)